MKGGGGCGGGFLQAVESPSPPAFAAGFGLKAKKSAYVCGADCLPGRIYGSWETILPSTSQGSGEKGEGGR
jgi:hypothetical protein